MKNNDKTVLRLRIAGLFLLFVGVALVATVLIISRFNFEDVNILMSKRDLVKNDINNLIKATIGSLIILSLLFSFSVNKIKLCKTNDKY